MTGYYSLKFDKWLKGQRRDSLPFLGCFKKSEELKDNRQGRKPPYLWTIKQSPEGATDSW
jgi:hypothetical protein